MQMYGNPEKIFIDTGIHIEYHTHGDPSAAEKIVLIMGLWNGKESWVPIVEEITNRTNDYEILSFDNRGSGGSDAPSGRYTTSQMAQDAIALMDKLEWKNAHIVGISMGGMISLEIAAAEPSRVKSLSLLVTSSGFPTTLYRGPVQISGLATMLASPFKKNLQDQIEGVMYLLYPDEYLDSKVSEHSEETWREKLMKYHSERAKLVRRPSRSGVFGQLMAVMSHCVDRKRLADISKAGFPILIVASLKDRLLHPKNSTSLYDDLQGKNTKLKVFENGGHGVIMQHRKEVADELLEMFRSVSSATHTRSQL